MSHCPQCGAEGSAGARFCKKCGGTMASPQLPPRDVRVYHGGQEWLSVEQVVNAQDKILGSIGALLVFVGAFTPWLQVWVFSAGSPQAWLCALAAVAAVVLLLRRRTGIAVMALGGIIALWALIFIISASSWYGSPSFGVFLTLIGGGMLAYSGFLTRRYEG